MIIGLTKKLKDDYGINVKNTDLFDEAFTHASYVNEHPKEHLKYYERIEFLGDAVMRLCRFGVFVQTLPFFAGRKTFKTACGNGL